MKKRKAAGKLCAALTREKETRCDLVQGYLFYRPMSAEDFEKKLAEQM